jgi:hypothetical protein
LKTIIKRSSSRSRSAGKRMSASEKLAKDRAIASTLRRLDRLEATTPTAKNLVVLLKSWVTDESGYDEETLPKLKRGLDAERKRVGARRLFDA